MTKPSSLWAHRHISEREVAHRWPDGQKDDYRWEDCTWCAGVMMARICHDTSIPATHAECELLRDEAGEDPLGGSGNDDLLRGFKRRYDYVPRHGTGASNFWVAMRPGVAGVAQGSMGVFPRTSPIRRHQPSFGGAHQMTFMRINTWDRVWFDDPLAPPTGYDGEYMSKYNLQRYMNGLPFPPSFLYDTMLLKPVPPPAPVPGGQPRARVKAGAWWDYSVSGNAAAGYLISRVASTTNGFTSTFGTRIKTEWGGEERDLVELNSGAYKGSWVDLNDVGSVTELAPA